jgi:hypothetical protein
MLWTGCYPGDDCTQMSRDAHAGLRDAHVELWLGLELAIALVIAILVARVVRRVWLADHRPPTWAQLMNSTIRIFVGGLAVLISAGFIDLAAPDDAPAVLVGLVTSLVGGYLAATGVVAKGIQLGLNERHGTADA